MKFFMYVKPAPSESTLNLSRSSVVTYLSKAISLLTLLREAQSPYAKIGQGSRRDGER